MSMRINRRSPALIEFWQRIAEVSTLLRLCGKLEKTLGNKQRQGDEYICRAALLLLCSHVEGFFEKLVEDIIRFHEISATSVGRLPIELRVTQAWKHSPLNNLAFEKRWEILKNICNCDFVDENKVCENGLFDLDLHIKGFANPGSKDVKKLFQTVGINNVWESVESLTGTGILQDSLNNLVSKRNPIAHGNSGVKPTPNDVRQHIVDMCKVASVFNNIVCAYIYDTFSIDNPWNVDS